MFAQFLWSLKSIFSGSDKKLSLAFLQITNYIYSPWKKVKKNVKWLNLFWNKIFIQWKLKLLTFLMDSVLIFHSAFRFITFERQKRKEMTKEANMINVHVHHKLPLISPIPQLWPSLSTCKQKIHLIIRPPSPLPPQLSHIKYIEMNSIYYDIFKPRM